MEVGGQCHALAPLPLGKTRYPLYRRLGDPRTGVNRYGISCPPPGFDPRTVQLVASHYTDRAIPAHCVLYGKSEIKPCGLKILILSYECHYFLQTAETVEAIVSQLMEKQRLARAAALTKQLECGCPDSTCADGKTCSHPMRRITIAKTGSATDLTSCSNTRQTVVSLSALNTENNNQVFQF